MKDKNYPSAVPLRIKSEGNNVSHTSPLCGWLETEGENVEGMGRPADQLTS